MIEERRRREAGQDHVIPIPGEEDEILSPEGEPFTEETFAEYKNVNLCWTIFTTIPHIIFIAISIETYAAVYPNYKGLEVFIMQTAVSFWCIVHNIFYMCCLPLKCYPC